MAVTVKWVRSLQALLQKNKDAEIVAGVEYIHHIQNTYPVFGNIADCNVEADVVIDFCAAPAVDWIIKILCREAGSVRIMYNRIK